MRVVGTPAHWALHAGALGGLLGFGVPAAFLVPSLWDLEAAWLALLVVPAVSGAVGAAVGVAAGIVQPAILDRVRRRVPLALIGVGQSLVGAAVGAAAAGAFPAMTLVLVDRSWIPIVVMAAMVGAGVGAIAALVWGLPFTVATVLRARPALVTVAVGVGLPAGFLATYATLHLLARG